MRVRKATELARELGIPRRTMAYWCKKEPGLAYKDKSGIYWIRLDRLAGRPGISLIEAYLLGSSRWIKATELARKVGVAVRSMIRWCLHRPGFAKRIGVDWYIDLERLDVSPDDVEQVIVRLGQSKPGGRGLDQ